MTGKCSCLEVIRVIAQGRVCSGAGDTTLGAERGNLQLVCLLHFLARYQDSLGLPTTHKHMGPFQLFKGSKINTRNCTGQSTGLNISPDLAFIIHDELNYQYIHHILQI